MGRCLRKRRRRQSRDSFDMSRDPKTIALLKWMRSNGWSEEAPLRLTKFPTVRGLASKKMIRPHQVLVSIPLSLVISRRSVSGDDELKDLSTQELLSLFLLREKAKGIESFWTPYLDTLPSSYTTPFFCLDREVDCLPSYLKEKVEQIRESFERSFQRARMFDTFFSKAEFAWAWFTVNTRAVYFESSMALVPFLDMFNHSSDASVSVNVSEDSYKLVTAKAIAPFKEVFINYGPHDDVKLLLEYGFIIGKENPHNHVPISLASLLSLSPFPDLSKSIILREGLGSNLAVDGSGDLNWNALACIFLLTLNREDLQSGGWLRVYREENLQEALAAVPKVILGNLLDDVQKSRRRLRELQVRSAAAEVALTLLDQHERLLL